MTIGITGGTGFVGKYVVAALKAKGYQTIIFTRTPQPDTANSRYAHWDYTTQTIDTKALAACDAIIHLAGEPLLEKRFTPSQKALITASREEATLFLVEAIRKYAPQCKRFIAASAIGYYKADADYSQLPVTESATPDQDFLATVVTAWEAASQTIATFCPYTILRFGIVLGRDGAGWQQFVQPTKLGANPLIAGGKQIVSWIHVADLAAMAVYCLEHDQTNAIYNAVAPAPCSYKTLMHTIIQARKAFAIPFVVPTFLLRMVLGEKADMITKSNTISAAAILAQGFTFQFPSIDQAVQDLV